MSISIGDGCDNATAARRLDSTEGTVATMRRNLHYKLKLNHRGDVVQFALRNGFVRFSRGMVVRPGFEHLRAAYHSRRTHKKSVAKVADSRARRCHAGARGLARGVSLDRIRSRARASS